MSKGTKIEILALTEKGQLALKSQLVQDLTSRNKFKLAPRSFSRGERKWFKTVSVADYSSAFPDRWEILGFKRMNIATMDFYYRLIKKEFISDGCCELIDFEVRFHDTE